MKKAPTSLFAIAITAAVIAGCADYTVEPTSPPPAGRALTPLPRPAVSSSITVLSVKDLGRLPGHMWSEARHINDLGAVTGTSFDSMLHPYPYLWQAGVRSDLSVLVRGSSTTNLSAEGMSRFGLVAVAARAGSGERNVVYDVNTGSRRDMNAYPVPIGCSPVELTDVNDAGMVVGNATCLGVGTAMKFVGGSWQRLTTTCLLGSKVRAVNERGSAAGSVLDSCARPLFSRLVGAHFRGPSGDHTFDCPGVGGGLHCATSFEALNDWDWAVGSDEVFSGRVWATSSVPSGMSLASLGMLYGVNNRNQVVGVPYPYWTAPLLWTRRSGPINLPCFGTDDICGAYDINNRNQIVGWSSRTDMTIEYQRRAVMWTIEADTVVVRGTASTISLSDPGTITVIISAPGFSDPSSIDVSTLELGNDVAKDARIARDAKGNPLSYLKDVDGDGTPELIAQFSIPAIRGYSDLSLTTTTLFLTGFRTTGVSIDGRLSVRVVP